MSSGILPIRPRRAAIPYRHGMTTTLLAPPRQGAVPRRGRWWPAARWALLLLVLASTGFVVAAGSHEASWQDLQSGLAGGRVHEVRIEGAMGGASGLPAGEEGYTTVRLLWREGWQRRTTEVWQATDAGERPGQGYDEDKHTIVGRVDTALATQSPDVDFTWGERPRAWTTLYGWQVVGSFAPWLSLVPAGAVLVLASGPEPRLATRWAWFWLFCCHVGFLAILVYLLIGARGRLPGRRRLTGGWAALLALLLLR